MKRIVSFLTKTAVWLLILLPLMGSVIKSQAQAAPGDPCCDIASEYYYSPSSGRCIGRTPGTSQPINCDPGEICEQTPDNAGACAVPKPTPTRTPEGGGCGTNKTFFGCVPIQNDEVGRCPEDTRPVIIDTVNCIGCECQARKLPDVQCLINGELTGTKTALGCIPTRADQFSPWLIGRAMAIAGGVAFILMVIAGFMILTASGKPERVQAGRELLTAAISGLLLIIFAIFILRLIGVNILQIPGLD
ncbi:MAG: hypothetical protein JW991_03670 [Candidatus Pacebacteria bacterium]|nr:hypothetical protein [Candidatus Paceibacterota bacterium]